MRAIAALLLCPIAVSILTLPAQAKPTRLDKHDEFRGDRYIKVAQPASARDVTNEVRRGRAGKARHLYRTKHPTRHKAPRKRLPPGDVFPRHGEDTNIFRRFANETINKVRSRTLSGVVGPLASKAREIESICGSRVISAVRHTYIRGTGGRLSLHASGRAVDIAGNPSCIYAQLRGWPGGVSVDYGRVRHVHVSFAPNGAEWGARFNHYRGGKRSRYAKHRNWRRYARR